ncbi:MAG: c-type cytochrome [Pseudomonadota bacterium]
MGELGLNKIFGGLLAVFLVVLGLREVSYMVFGGGHHHHHEYESLNQWAEENFAYFVEMAEVSGSDDAEIEVYDLGLLLAGADIAVGERSFNAQCKTCHSLEQGGNNGTGPNLYNILGSSKGQVAGFNYSGALDRTEGSWSYENMDNWLRAPSQYAQGTSMAFAGLRRDPQRASVLAYLASYAPDAPAFPAPLEAAEPVEETVEEAVVEAVAEASDTPLQVIEQSVEDTTEVLENVAEDTAEAVDNTVDSVVDTVEDVATDVTEAAPEPDTEN